MNIMLTPLLIYMGANMSELLLVISNVIMWSLVAPIFVVAGIQDKRTHTISGSCLVSIYVVTLVHALLFVNVLLTVIVLVLGIFAFRNKEIALVGQADFVLLAHWLTASLCFGGGDVMMVVSSVVLLICIFVYIAVYRDEKGRRWHHGKMVPIFPPYAASVVLMALISIPLGLHLYEGGWYA